MEQEAHGRGLGEQREFFEVRILQVRYLRGVVLIRAHVDVRCLVWREGGVLLDAIDLGQKSVRVVAVKMQEGKLCATAADIQFGRAAVESRAQRVGKPAVEPVGKEIFWQWFDIREKFG